jgi:hypothetical protein
MFTVFVLTVRVALLTLVLAAFIAVQLSRAQRMIADDTDNDGLPNQWETSGHGPIKPGEHGCSPKRADMFLVICIRPGMTRAQVEPTLNEVKRFFVRYRWRTQTVLAASTSSLCGAMTSQIQTARQSTTNSTKSACRGNGAAWRTVC